MDNEFLILAILVVLFIIIIKFIKKDSMNDIEEHTMYENSIKYNKIDNFFKKLKKIFKRKKQ